MKRVIRMGLPFIAVFTLTACGNNQSKGENQDGHDHAAMEQEQSKSQVQAGPVTIKDDQLNAVYQHYIHLTTALTNSDAAEAKVASNAIEAGAKDLNGGSAVAASAAQITAASDIEAQRTAYSKLSNEMITLVKKAGLSSGELYVEYCPMAFNEKGASWISTSQEIRNPYFGKKMLECGEVQDTIK
jgi:major membrane immunogen (membrane-anchored lipoprotein)